MNVLTWKRMLGCLITGLLLGAFVVPGAFAVTIYSYIDDQGNMVATDALDTIPDKYRSRVRSHERLDVPPPTPSFLQTVQRRVHNTIKEWGPTIPSFRAEGLGPQQSRILTYAGGIAVVLVAVMCLSKSQFLRLLGFCLLVVLGIGTPVLLYVSDGGALDVMKTQATKAGQAQHNRLQQAGQ
ncbi:MAG: hypothetical protein ICV75_02535 [Nitrospiraceae bacterium]|nr:hypothetical protein [Nitrospiraceae bacterium]